MTRTPAALVLALLALVIAGCGDDDDSETASKGPSGTMIMATTTSTKDSGLLDELVPAFERTGDCKVKTVAVGSGQALAMGEKGDADVLLVHSPDAEETFMDEGHGASRTAVMHNDFVIVGPASDPADIADGPDATTAFRRIAREKAPFVSRADESGTNAKELNLWEEAGIKPSGSWYLETGQGMGETLTVASQKEAYTLSDRGTFLATNNLDSKLLKEGGKDLRNNYHVIVVKAPGSNAACAKAFSSWITSAPTQKEIAGFGVKEYGEPLFFPDPGK
jgi:tungstate transport system substrate-binding protein